MSEEAPVTRLPYPHARNDCIACRERDADVLLVDEQTAGKREPALCQQCLGKHLAYLVLQHAGDDFAETTTVTLALAPGGLSLRSVPPAAMRLDGCW